MNNFLNKTLFVLIESLLRNIGGGLGQRLRYAFYRKRFKSCGKNVRIDVGVIFENTDCISIGNDVWFLPYSIITAKPKITNSNTRLEKKRYNNLYHGRIGDIVIGNEVSIGAYNILQGYGGLKICDRVTTSARVSLYSYSHHTHDPTQPKLITYANSMVKDSPISCIESPIVLEDGVWLGLGVSVFAGTIGKNSFVAANSIVILDIVENSYAVGNPAKRIKERFKI